MSHIKLRSARAVGIVHAPFMFNERYSASMTLGDLDVYSGVIYPFFETFYKLTGMCFPIDFHVVIDGDEGGEVRFNVVLGHDRRRERIDDGDQH